MATTLEFFTATGPEHREFGLDTPNSKSLRNSYLTVVALREYVEKSN